MQKSITAEDILSFMQLAVEDLNNTPDVLGPQKDFDDHIFSELAFAGAAALAFEEVKFSRFYCTLKGKGAFLASDDAPICAILNGLSIERRGLRDIEEIKRLLLQDTALRIQEKEGVEDAPSRPLDFIDLNEQDLRAGNASHAFTSGSWQAFLAGRASAHRAAWEAAHLDASTVKGAGISARTRF